MSLNLTPGKVSLADLSQIYWESPAVTLNSEAKQAVEQAKCRCSDLRYQHRIRQTFRYSYSCGTNRTPAKKPDPLTLLWSRRTASG